MNYRPHEDRTVSEIKRAENGWILTLALGNREANLAHHMGPDQATMIAQAMADRIAPREAWQEAPVGLGQLREATPARVEAVLVFATWHDMVEFLRTVPKIDLQRRSGQNVLEHLANVPTQGLKCEDQAPQPDDGASG